MFLKFYKCCLVDFTGTGLKVILLIYVHYKGRLYHR